MNKKSYLNLVGYIFGIIAILHALRLLFGWDAQIGEWDVPTWLSWAALLVAAWLSWQAFTTGK